MSDAELIPIAPRKLVNDSDGASSGAAKASAARPTLPAASPAKPAAKPATTTASAPKTSEIKNAPKEVSKDADAEKPAAAKTETAASARPAKISSIRTKSKKKKTRADAAQGVATPLDRKKRRLIQEAMRARRLTPEQILEAKRKKRARRLMAVAASVLLITLSSGGYWAWTGPYADFFFPPEELPPREVELNTSFEVAGVQFGMTPDMVEDLHTITRRDTLTERDYALSFEKNKASHTVWFRQESGLDEAWKVRYRQPEIVGDVDAAIDPIVSAMGPAYQSSCDKSAFNGDTNCTFRWFGGDGVDITVNARTKSTDATARTALTVTAEDHRVLERQKRYETYRLAMLAHEQRKQNEASADATKTAAEEQAAKAALQALEDAKQPKIELTVFSATPPTR